MERAAPSKALTLGRNVGIQLSDHHLGERLTWAAGAFWDADLDNLSDTRSDGSASFTGRLTCLPWCAEEGAKLLHLGLAASLRPSRSNGHEARLASRPSLHLAPTFIDTGALDEDDAVATGLGAALVHGPLAIQGEYVHSRLELADGSGEETRLHGGYVEASYFLTGEHREYNRHTGVFGRLVPRHSTREGGPGAWQVALRYDCVDLNDGAVRDGEMSGWTFGVNWYLNSSARIMLNCSRADVEDVGEADLLGIRFQVDF
jgi:phosphate-selective porin OprO/OprP